jgi:hypothetical protein
MAYGHLRYEYKIAGEGLKAAEFIISILWELFLPTGI